MTPSILEWVGFKRIGDIGDHIISVSDLGQFGCGVWGSAMAELVQGFGGWGSAMAETVQGFK